MTSLKFRPDGLAKRAYEYAIRWNIPRIVPTLIRSFPHDPMAFTQGLAICNGRLYESTGIDRGQPSTLREVCLETGRVLRCRTIENDFAEGIACMGDEITQIFWKSGVARVYHRSDFEPLRDEHFEGEGWGLTACPRGLAMTTGGTCVVFRNRQFEPTGKLRVTSNGFPLRRLNDIEYFDERFLANVWCATDLFAICPVTGRLTHIVDCSAIARCERNVAGDDAILNGIAYNQDTGTFVITGKRWYQMYEIQLLFDSVDTTAGQNRSS